MNKAYIIGGLALAAVFVAGIMFPRTTVVERVVERVVEQLGAGADTSFRQEFQASFVQGGAFNLATTASAATLSDRQISDVSVIFVGPVTGNDKSPALTLTLPASTTWPSLTKNGHVQRWIVDNTHTAAATTTTITAGAGVDIDGTTANDDVINGGVAGTLSCWRLPNTDVRCIVEEMVDAG